MLSKVNNKWIGTFDTTKGKMLLEDNRFPTECICPHASFKHCKRLQ